MSHRALLLCSFAMGLVAGSKAAAAATKFIRAGATGLGDGSDWTNAYPSLPATWVRGDTYYVASGTYSSGTNLHTPPSGTTAVTIRGATASDHGSPNGWTAAYSVCSAEGGSPARFPGGWTVSTGYWTVDGACGGGSRGNGTTTGYGFVTRAPADGFGALGFTFTTSVSGIHIAHYEIDGIDCCSMGTSANGRDGLLCEGGCNVDGTFDHLYVHDVGRTAFLMGGDVTLQHSYLARNRSTPAQHAEAWSYRGGTAVIRWNIFEDIRGTGQFVQLYGSGQDHEVYGNVFRVVEGACSGCNGSAFPVTDNNPTGSISGLKFYNNTIYGMDANPGVGSINGSSGYDVKNNLWFNNAYGASISGVSDYNSVWGTYWYGGASGAHSSWRCLQAGGGDPSGNCAGNNDLVAPSAAATFVSAPTDLRPRGDTVEGLSMSGTALGPPYDVDMEGHTRTRWTRGAYEYWSGPTSSPPAAPTMLRVQ